MYSIVKLYDKKYISLVIVCLFSPTIQTVAWLHQCNSAY